MNAATAFPPLTPESQACPRHKYDVMFFLYLSRLALSTKHPPLYVLVVFPHLDGSRLGVKLTRLSLWYSSTVEYISRSLCLLLFLVLSVPSLLWDVPVHELTSNFLLVPLFRRIYCCYISRAPISMVLTVGSNGQKKS